MITGAAAKRASRLRRVACLASIVALFVLALTLFVYLRSEALIDERYATPSEALELAVPVTVEQVERGRHLATTVVQCGFCHGEDLGGRALADDRRVGRLFAPNLTTGAGGLGGQLKTSDWVRAIRFGVAQDGRSLILKPSAYQSRMSDGDLAAVIAYMRTVPPIDRSVPEAQAGWLTRLALATGLASDLLSARAAHATKGRPAAPPPAATPEYGAYLVDLANCRVCHHASLQGGLHPLAFADEPEPADLRPGGALERYSRADFARAMRQGLTPEGRALDPAFMPWPLYAGLSELELDALWRYLTGRS